MKFVRDKAHCKHESYTKEEIDNKVTTLNNSIGTKANANNVYTKGDFVILTGTITTDHYGMATITYPSDYNMNNCVIISSMCKYYKGTSYVNSYWFNWQNPENVLVFDSSLDSSGIALSWVPGELGSDVTKIDYKVVLMKIS